MIQGILQQLLKNQFGINWAQIDAELSGDFLAAVLEEPGQGRYYEFFSNMSTDELKKTAQDIGTMGKTDIYPTSNGNRLVLIITPVLLLIVLMGGVIFMLLRKKATGKY